MESASEESPPVNQPVSVPAPDQPQSVQDVPPQPPEASKPHHSGHGTVSQVRDTLETVLLALILAFSFRTFCVEAMVIPTGSLAPTLDG
ncbi:MAG TPA: hypothetical protein VKJ65_03870, partial [Phycisphaerae bacterium]|nr:hypothetical protein [Phycisphaerae bacterium]